MHLVILSGAARPQSASNTAKIIAAFRRGYEAEGNTAEVWYLSDRKQWTGAAQAFAEHDHILIALPLYVENIPGILLEFLSELTPKAVPGTEISFLLQGGFPEASQSDCCLAYLETLPAQLGCSYAGTLHKGDLFGLGLMDEAERAKLLVPFTEMGRQFAKIHRFDRRTAEDFAGPAYLPTGQRVLFRLVGHAVQRVFMGRMAKNMGCCQPLDARPYQSFLSGEQTT